MKEPSISLLCCPRCKNQIGPYQIHADDPRISEGLFCKVCGIRYTEEDGCIDFLGEAALAYTGRREEIIRNLYARAYTPLTNLMFLFCGGAARARDEVMSHLQLRMGDTVLETGTGPGENFRWMASRTQGLHLFGIDIQRQMIKSCMANLERWGITADIFRADAEELPFTNDSFDVVFHLGAINLFSDKGKAIREMIRVARPGTHIVIADETEKAGKMFRFITGSNENNDPPVDLIPRNMTDIQLSIIWKGYGYLIEFTKP